MGYVQLLKYAYHTQTHFAQGISSINIFFAEQLSETPTSSHLTRTVQDMLKEAQWRHTNQRLLEPI